MFVFFDGEIEWPATEYKSSNFKAHVYYSVLTSINLILNLAIRVLFFKLRLILFLRQAKISRKSIYSLL